MDHKSNITRFILLNAKKMKAHRQSKTDKFKKLCSKRVSAGWVVSDEVFFKMLKEQPEICCKKCQESK